MQHIAFWRDQRFSRWQSYLMGLVAIGEALLFWGCLLIYVKVWVKLGGRLRLGGNGNTVRTIGRVQVFRHQ
jgi:hypothetical protein